MKRILGRGVAVLAALLAMLLLSVPVVNDLMAERIADGLRALPLPEGTELVETAYAAGKLAGSGNGMQYFGAILLRSGLSLGELKAYYSNYAGHDWECRVEPQQGGAIRVIEHGGLRFDAPAEGEGFYIVYSWGDGAPFFEEFDLRGH